MPDKDTAAEQLIDWHFRVEPSLREVYRILAEDELSPNEPIKLLEINEATVETGEVSPFGFAGTDEIPFRTVIAEVTPQELERIRSDDIALPAGWSLSRARRYTRQIAS